MCVAERRHVAKLSAQWFSEDDTNVFSDVLTSLYTAQNSRSPQLADTLSRARVWHLRTLSREVLLKRVAVCVSWIAANRNADILGFAFFHLNHTDATNFCLPSQYREETHLLPHLHVLEVIHNIIFAVACALLVWVYTASTVHRFYDNPIAWWSFWVAMNRFVIWRPLWINSSTCFRWFWSITETVRPLRGSSPMIALPASNNTRNYVPEVLNVHVNESKKNLLF